MKVRNPIIKRNLFLQVIAILCLTFFGMQQSRAQGDCTEATIGFTTNATFCYLVDFTSSVTGVTPLSYSWNFGEGTVASVPHPTMIYQQPGNYNIALTITYINRFGETCSQTYNEVLNVCEYNSFEPCIAYPFTYTATPDQNNCGSYNFVANTGTIQEPILGYLWNFGDGSALTVDPSPDHTYAQSGTYVVQVTVLYINNNRLCGSTTYRPLVVDCATEPCPGVNLSFTHTEDHCGIVNFTSQANQAIDSYAWDFGNGTISSDPDPTAFYALATGYNVTLTVQYTDALGNDCTESYSQQISTCKPSIATGCKPNPFQSLAVQPGVCLNMTFYLNVASGINVLSYTWDFGDGTPFSTDATPTHIYDSPGGYWVTVTYIYENINGEICQASENYDLTVPPPTLKAGFIPAVDCGQLEVVFNNTSVGAVEYEWDYGDENQSTNSQSAHSHTYAAPGKYTVTLTAINGPCTDVYTEEIIVGDPVAAFTHNAGACSGRSITFTNTSEQASTYQWDFGDGHTSNHGSPVHTYASPGNYTVTLAAGRPGCPDDDITQQITVEAQPQANFFTDAGCTGLTVSFTNTTLDGVTYSWDFGDGQTSNAQHPTNPYAQGGQYLVTLVATNGNCSDDVTKVVNVDGPEADFFADDVCFGQDVVFTNNSTTFGVTTYSWVFGDASPADNAEDPRHFYQAPGTYTVTLTVNSNGCTDVMTQDVTVHEDLTADFSAPNVCHGIPVTFTNLSTGTGSYLWEFGDGQTSSLENPTYLYAAAGTYPVTLTHFLSGCSDVITKDIIIYDDPDIQIDADGPLTFCEGEKVKLSATINNSISGVNYTYEWLLDGDPLGTLREITVNSGGTYILNVSSDAGCQATTSATIVVNPLPDPVVDANSIQGVTCSGANDGVATIQLPAGTYTFDWPEPSTATTATATDLPQGDWFVTVTDANGCSAAVLVQIPYEGPALNVQSTPIACDYINNASANSIITATVTNGATPINFDWYDDGGNLLASGSSNQHTVNTAGVFRVVMTDGNGCVLENNNINVITPQLTVSISNTRSCGNDPVPVQAAVSILPGSAVPAGYTFEWFTVISGVETPLATDPVTSTTTAAENTDTRTLGILPVGDVYRLKVTDNTYNCQEIIDFEIEMGVPLELVVNNPTPPSCSGASGGLAIASVTGAIGEISYEWWEVEGGVNTTLVWEEAIFENLGPGDKAYQVIVTDGTTGCTATFNFSISGGELMAFEEVYDEFGNLCTNPLNNDLPCEVDVNGCAVTTMVTGGIAPYTFHWEELEDDGNGNYSVVNIAETTSPDGIVAGLGPGIYQVRVEDANECVIVSGPFEIEIVTAVRNYNLFLRWRVTPKPCEDCEEEVVQTEEEEVVEEITETLNEFVEDCERSLGHIVTTAFEEQCEDPQNLIDELEVSYQLYYHHYTLYYHDRAGNLVRTVPPNGVHILTNTDDRLSRPVHSYETKYRHNSFGQLVEQSTPDGGRALYMYDYEGKLRFSQNDEQRDVDLGDPERYIYIKYDKLGRALETGEANLVAPNTTFADLSKYVTDPESADYDVLFPQTDRHDVVFTIYNTPGTVDYFGKKQRFLKNRVSYTYTDEDGNTSSTNDQVYNWFSYDPHGNVEWMIQKIPGFTENYYCFEYDLISNNIIKIKFNEHRTDRYFHRYEYDEDNRLVNVFTSQDGRLWDRDANYERYTHGTKRRVNLGEDKIQGIDYVYTLHKWLKSMNEYRLDPVHDPGEDGLSGGMHPDVLPDVFGQTMNYYRGDFKHAGSVFEKNAGVMTAFQTDMAPGNLYNANISSIFSNTDRYGVKELTGNIYTYDRLNRLSSTSYASYDPGSGSWSKPGDGDDYDASFIYDPNGNILELVRNAYGAGNSEMDKLRYGYENKANGYAEDRNRLRELEDLTANASIDGTMDDIIGLHSYEYDGTGNLITETEPDPVNSDYQIETTVNWSPNGLVKHVVKERKHKTNTNDVTEILNMTFRYDAYGNRVHKEVVRDGDEKGSYYALGPDGSVMAIYERELSTDGTQVDFKLKERPIYGQDRLGLDIHEITLKSVASDQYDHNTYEGFDLDGLDRKSEYRNWISAANAEIQLDAANKVCQTKIRDIHFSNGGIDVESVPPELMFMGKVTNNVVIAEDLEGNRQFFAAVADEYYGQENALLIFDKDHQLLKGSDGLLMEASAKAMVMKKPGINNIYLLFTIDANGNPNYMEVDMDAQGFAPGGDPPAGAVVNTVQMDFSGNYGRHMAVVEDRTTGEHIVYMTRYTDPILAGQLGQTEILAWVFTDGVVPSLPLPVAQFESLDETGNGALQISKDGENLVYFNRKFRIGAFAHRQADVRSMILSPDRQSISGNPVAFQANAGGNYGKGTADFGLNKEMVYFGQQSVFLDPVTTEAKNIWHYNTTSSGLTNVFVGFTHEYGEIRRGFDEKLYVASRESEDKISQVTPLGGGIFDVQPVTLTGTPQAGLFGSWPTQSFRIAPVDDNIFERSVDKKLYELKDHLGNVRAVVSDMRVPVDDNSDDIPDRWVADLESYVDYYAYGMMMPDKKAFTGKYRYGYQGQEKDDEIKGEGNAYNFGSRSIYDGRVARFVSVDPQFRNYPGMSPYAFAANNPVVFDDQDGEGAIDFRLKEYLSEDSYYMTGLLAGIGDGLIETADLLIGAAKFNMAINPFHPSLFFYTDEAAQMRADAYEIGKLAMNLVTDDELRAKVWTNIKKELGEWWDQTTFQGTNAEAGYQHGKIVFDILISLVGVGEVKYLLKTGQFSVKALGKIALSNAKKQVKSLKPCGCFTAGTLVLTREGFKKIEEINSGDLVWAFNDTTGNLELKQVISTFKRKFDQIFQIYYEGEMLEATHEHPFYVEGKWINADKLKVGDSLTLWSGGKVVIDSIVIVNGDFNVYNFTVEEFHTYYVSTRKLLVHNGKPCDFAQVGKILRWELKHGDNSAKKIGEIKQKILKDGLESMDPIHVFQHGDEVLLVDGHHRLAAARELGLTNVPVKYLTKQEFNIAAKQMGRFSTPEALSVIANRKSIKNGVDVLSKDP